MAEAALLFYIVMHVIAKLSYNNLEMDDQERNRSSFFDLDR